MLPILVSWDGSLRGMFEDVFGCWKCLWDVWDALLDALLVLVVAED